MQLENLVLRVQKLHELKRAIKHPLRIKLVKYLLEHPDTNVTTVYRKFKLEQSVASQQLSILRKAGMVIATRQGKNISFSSIPKGWRGWKRERRNLQNEWLLPVPDGVRIDFTSCFVSLIAKAKRIK